MSTNTPKYFIPGVLSLIGILHISVIRKTFYFPTAEKLHLSLFFPRNCHVSYANKFDSYVELLQPCFPIKNLSSFNGRKSILKNMSLCKKPDEAVAMVYCTVTAPAVTVVQFLWFLSYRRFRLQYVWESADK